MIIFIKEYRKIKNMSLRRLASTVHYSYNYLNQLENNIKHNPKLELFDKVGKALEVCPIRLLGGCYGGYCNPECPYYKSYYDIPKL